MLVLHSSSTHAASTGWQPALQDDNHTTARLVTACGICTMLTGLEMHLHAPLHYVQQQHPRQQHCVVHGSGHTRYHTLVPPHTLRCQCNPPCSAPFCMAAVCGSQLLLLSTVCGSSETDTTFQAGLPAGSNSAWTLPAAYRQCGCRLNTPQQKLLPRATASNHHSSPQPITALHRVSWASVLVFCVLVA